MLEATKANIKLAKKTASANLLEGLLVRKVGTNIVEKIAMRMTYEKERN